MTGAAATRARFLADAGHFDVIHFGGHAVVNPLSPLLSQLLFAPDSSTDPASGAVTAGEIEGMHFANTSLVVLAACGSADGDVFRGAGAMSLARSWLDAGVPTVIASLWNVDDQEAEVLFSRFYARCACRETLRWRCVKPS